VKTRKIYLRPEEDLQLFVLFLLSAYYLSFRALFLLLSVPFWYKKNISRLPLLAGLLCGIFLGGVVIREQESSSAGLDVRLVERITIEVGEDSFLSSKGRQVVKGSLLSVSGWLGTECSALGEVLVLGSDEQEPLFQGEIIELECELKDMEDSPDLAFIAFSRGSVEQKGWTSSLWEFRRRIIQHFDAGALMMSPRVKSLFLALFRGNSDYLSRQLKENFRMSGVPHLLALSGFHVAIVVLVLTGMVQFFVGKKTAAALAVLPLFGYMVFAGGSPSLLRAVLMFFLGVLFRLGGRKISLISLLLLTAVLQLFLRPVEGWSLSFQLSYLALAGLVVFGRRFLLNLETLLPPVLAVPLCASLGAHLATAALLIVQFGEIYPVGILSSLIVTPLIVLFMWFSLAAYGAGLIGCPVFLSELLGRICHILYSLTEKAVSYFAGFPSVNFSRGNGGALYLSIVLIVVIWLYRSLWRGYGRREKSQFKLRFPNGNKSLARNDGIGPRKKWSQNFLINSGARQRLVDALEINKGDRIWEIGPGLGAITKHILEKEADLTVFEIDPGYIEYLSMAFADEKSFKIVKGDVVKTWINEYEIAGCPDGVIGNFPYNAASAIIASFIEKRKFPRQLAAIVQSEMADRITAKPGSKNYSSFSIICQYACDVREVGGIGSGSFFPKPNVSSKIITMLPRKDTLELIDPDLFFILVRDCFSSRRKTLQNNLKNASARRLQKYGTDLLFQGFESQGIALSTRAERVTVDQFVAVANEISRLFQEG